MCSHRSRGHFDRMWSRLIAAWLSSFAVAEIYGLVAVGPEATLTYHLRRRAGLLEPCRHSTAGRLVILAFSAWLAAHLGYGRFGVAPPARLHRCHTPQGPRRPS